MDRQVDREIQGWRRLSAHDQLRLLWHEESRDGVSVMSYWDAGPWTSPYVIAGSETSRLRGTFRALTEINFGERSRDATFLTNQEFEGPPIEYLNWDVREARFRLGRSDSSGRPELCDWLIAIGRRRDEIDIPRLRGYADHEDKVVRYTVLGMLSWNPSIGNDQLLRMFGSDEDGIVAELAERFGAARAIRATRGSRLVY